MDSAYVLDSYALIAHFEDEPAGEQVRKLLRTARAGRAKLYLSVVNFGEILYTTMRERGEDKAEEVCLVIDQMPLSIVDADRDLTMEAARLKARHPVAYADCFAAALAVMKRAKVVTGDPEFRKFKEAVKIDWLSD